MNFRCVVHTIFLALFALSLCGCRAIPTNTAAAISRNPLKRYELSRPIKIGIKPEFKTSVSALFIRNTDQMVANIVEKLNRQDTALSFLAIPTFSISNQPNLDYILKLSCVSSSENIKQDPLLMGLGLPATFSLIGTPLGIAALSTRGAETQENKFIWQYQLLEVNGSEKQISPKFDCISKVSATGWGIPEEIVTEAFCLTQNDLYNHAIHFLNHIEPKLTVATVAPKKSAISLKPVEKGFGDEMFAIVIGVSTYQNSPKNHGLSNLNYADNDAVEFSKLLVSMGWKKENIQSLINEEATEDAITEVCKDWAARSRNETLLLYWSGHAYPDIADPERVFLACYDSQTHKPSTAVEMSDLRRHLTRHEAHNVILIADTCHSGNIISRGNSKGLAIRPALDAMQKKKHIPKGWVIIASADSDRKAYEDKAWSHGAMTYALLQGLRGSADGYGPEQNLDQQITLGELKAYVTKKMGSETLKETGVKLEPLFYTTTSDSSIWDLTLTPFRQ